jgi:hypothetical protein
MVQILMAVVFSAGMSSCAVPQGGGLGPTEGQFSSQWVGISMGGVMGIPGEGMVLALDLKNRSRQDLHVLVEFVAPDPTQRCEVEKQIDASKSSFFSCPQKSLTPDKDYPVRLYIYTDKERKNLIESPQTKFRFSESDAKAFDELSRRLQTEKTK